MKINFIPFSEIEKKQLIEYMFDKLDVISVNNDSHKYLVTGYDCKKYICQYSNEEIAEIAVLIITIVDEMRRAKANGFNKASFINIINKHSYDNVYKTIDCFREIASKQMLYCIWRFISLIPDKQPFNLCIIEFTLMHGISWVYLQLLESDNYDTCKDIAVELLNLFLTTTGKKYTFTA